MSRVCDVLDASALLAHYFNEPGAGVVEELWSCRMNPPGLQSLQSPLLN